MDTRRLRKTRDIILRISGNRALYKRWRGAQGWNRSGFLATGTGSISAESHPSVTIVNMIIVRSTYNAFISFLIANDIVMFFSEEIL
jgi:hypothetical protein